MKFFSHLTSTVATEGKQNAVIMGRNTWESIPKKYRPLPRRLNIVLSRKMSEPPEGAVLCSSLQDALDRLRSAPYTDTVEKVFVIGGTTVYEVTHWWHVFVNNNESVLASLVGWLSRYISFCSRTFASKISLLH